MAYYLVSDRTGQYIELPNPISVNYGTDAYTIEIKCTMLDTSNNNTLLGQSVTTSTTDNNISFTTSGRLQIAAGGSNAYFTSANFGLFDGLPHVYRLEHDAGGAWRAYRDGTLFQSSSYSTSRTGTNPLSRLFRQSTTSATSSWNFYYLTITGFSVNDTWDANLSGGTGSVLPSLSGSNNGTQAGSWPSDDSEWVFYSTGGGTVSASVAVTMPQFSASVAASKTAPSSAASVTLSMPQMSAAVSAQNLAPSSGATISFTMPQMSASVIADNAAPVFASVVSATMPQFSLAASAENTLPGSGAVVSFAMPQMVAAVSVNKTVPTYSSSVAATMPQFAVSIAGSALVDVKAASISFTMPQFAVSVAGSNIVPIRQASIAFTMPQMRAQVLTGGVAFYQDPRAHIELVAASRHLEYTNPTRHIELRRA